MARDTSTLSETNPYKSAKTIQDAARVTASQLAVAANYAGQLSENPAWLQAGASLQDQIFTLLNTQINALLADYLAWLALPG